ncbi:Ig-like domain-containing protein [Dysgonomonas sp. 520]|uniref:Ig-like domain-containing protein n=1 Tax=Dysgonomonas sp. 520 TaxID=2302931 RepID=UPI0013D8C07C|nr:Ig-like domain-containing protein [Dysgonomonas sp. 520]NDW11202.1 T9SS C-terminal target domain-containing protein [Dysgonomonas sp. 520]
MKNRIKYTIAGLFLCAFLIPCSSIKAQKVTGMSDFKLYVDPGHSQKENGGLYNYSEAEKTVRVALALKEYLLTHTDMKPENLKLCREDDTKTMSLTQRTDEANAFGADFYYSIHSDAADATAPNRTLTLYGGRRLVLGGDILEKLPEGGKAFGDILCPDLTGAMRTADGTRGNQNDHVFYNYTTSLRPYLHVNRESNMASLLSEAAFHTHPVQQQRNINADWKRLEALAAFRSIVKYKGLTPPALGFASGFLKDGETGVYANGVTVTLVDPSAGTKTYKTDDYETVFKNYSNDPDLLHNGFYFIEGLTPGATVDVTITSPNFQTVNKTLKIPTDPSGSTIDNIGILDVDLVSTVPAKVVSVLPEDLTSVVRDFPMTIKFSREMDRASVESAISVVPAKTVSYSWDDNFTLNIDVSALDYETAYTLIIDGSVAKNSETNQFIDGNRDGIAGGDCALAFTISPMDTQAPQIVAYDPKANDATKLARPVIRLEYDEEITAASVTADHIKLTPAVAGTVQLGTANGRSALHFIPSEDLADFTSYTVNIAAGLKDQLGNATTAESFTFSTDIESVDVQIDLDAFESLGAGWWALTGSGSTANVKPAPATVVEISSTYTSGSTSTKSARLTYAWDLEATSGSPFIRWYLPASNSKNNLGTFNEDYILRTYVFGDGSKNKIRYNMVDGLGKYETNAWLVLDFVGWKLMEWDLTKGEAYAWVNGNGVIDPGNPFYLDSYQMSPGTGADANGMIYLDNFYAVKLKAKVGIDNADADKKITVRTIDGYVKVAADSSIKEIKIYSLSGGQVKAMQPNELSCDIATASIPAGVYIIKVMTDTSQRAEKIIVK